MTKTIETRNKFFVFDESLRRALTKRDKTPFKNYIGQDRAVEMVLDLLYQGFSNEYHLIPENVMLAGPPSCGKTHMVSLLAEALKTPLTLTDASRINSGIQIGDKKIPGGTDTIIHLMLDAWARHKHGPLQGVKAGSFIAYSPPPMIVFIDEIHGLKRNSVDALLTVTERNSGGMMFGRDTVVDCRNVLWIGATTSVGKLHKAFISRFKPRIDLLPPTKEEVAQIVKLNHPSLSDEACRKIVFYGSVVPREALAFARSVIRFSERSGLPLEDSVWGCAQREGIDQWGMRRQRLDILKVLGSSQDGTNLRNLSAAIYCEADEIVNEWLPLLLFSQPPLVSFDGSVYEITDAGRAELAKRGL